MPLVRYEIRNEHSLANPQLYRTAAKDDPEGLLEGVAMAGLVGIVRQLGDLAEFAAELFRDLHEEVMATASRGHDLLARVQQLEAEMPVVEKALLSETNQLRFAYTQGVEFHASIRNDQNHCTQGDLPRFIRSSYEECRGPPRLFLLDKFDIQGAGACLKRYTDPSFFRTEWASSELMKAERVQRDKKARREKKKGRRRRNGEGMMLGEHMQTRFSQELSQELRNKKEMMHAEQLQSRFSAELSQDGDGKERKHGDQFHSRRSQQSSQELSPGRVHPRSAQKPPSGLSKEQASSHAENNNRSENYNNLERHLAEAQQNERRNSHSRSPQLPPEIVTELPVVQKPSPSQHESNVVANGDLARDMDEEGHVVINDNLSRDRVEDMVAAFRKEEKALEEAATRSVDGGATESEQFLDALTTMGSEIDSESEPRHSQDRTSERRLSSGRRRSQDRAAGRRLSQDRASEPRLSQDSTGDAGKVSAAVDARPISNRGFRPPGIQIPEDEEVPQLAEQARKSPSLDSSQQENSKGSRPSVFEQDFEGPSSSSTIRTHSRRHSSESTPSIRAKHVNSLEEPQGTFLRSPEDLKDRQRTESMDRKPVITVPPPAGLKVRQMVAAFQKGSLDQVRVEDLDTLRQGSNMVSPPLESVNERQGSNMVSPPLESVSERRGSNPVSPPLESVSERRGSNMVSPPLESVNEPQRSNVVSPPLESVSERQRSSMVSPPLESVSEPQGTRMVLPTMESASEPQGRKMVLRTMESVSEPQGRKVASPGLGFLSQATLEVGNVGFPPYHDTENDSVENSPGPVRSAGVDSTPSEDSYSKFHDSPPRRSTAEDTFHSRHSSVGSLDSPPDSLIYSPVRSPVLPMKIERNILFSPDNHRLGFSPELLSPGSPTYVPVLSLSPTSHGRTDSKFMLSPGSPTSVPVLAGSPTAAHQRRDSKFFSLEDSSHQRRDSKSFPGEDYSHQRRDSKSFPEEDYIHQRSDSKSFHEEDYSHQTRDSKSFSEEDYSHQRRDSKSFAQEDYSHQRQDSKSFPQDDYSHQRRGSKSFSQEDSSRQRRDSNSFPEEDYSHQRRDSKSFPEEDYSHQRRDSKSFAQEDSSHQRKDSKSFPQEDSSHQRRDSKSFSQEESSHERRNSKSFSQEDSSFHRMESKFFASEDDHEENPNAWVVEEPMDLISPSTSAFEEHLAPEFKDDSESVSVATHIVRDDGEISASSSFNDTAPNDGPVTAEEFTKAFHRSTSGGGTMPSVVSNSNKDRSPSPPPSDMNYPTSLVKQDSPSSMSTSSRSFEADSHLSYPELPQEFLLIPKAAAHRRYRSVPPAEETVKDSPYTLPSSHVLPSSAGQSPSQSQMPIKATPGSRLAEKFGLKQSPPPPIVHDPPYQIPKASHNRYPSFPSSEKNIMDFYTPSAKPLPLPIVSSAAIPSRAAPDVQATSSKSTPSKSAHDPPLQALSQGLPSPVPPSKSERGFPSNSSPSFLAPPPLPPPPPALSMPKPRSAADLQGGILQGIAAHDKSKLKKTKTMQNPSLRKEDDRSHLLEQIRTQSFNLRRTVLDKVEAPPPRPVTNINVAAILEKANAIRQAFAGSDEDDDENWD